jgi:uncharacterized protein YbjQ (UPF0145 family)
VENFIDLIVFLVLLALGYIFGSRAERRHYASITEREQKWLRLPAVPSAVLPEGRFEAVGLACGNVVISVDYFKRFAAGLRNLFGGRVSAYESLLDRARREAVLRMKESCPSADMILNVRVSTSAVGGQESSNRGVACVEVLAYGTAVKKLT